MIGSDKVLLAEKALLAEKDLHSYQQFCVIFVENKPQCALFLDCGLGKTVIALTAISHRTCIVCMGSRWRTSSYLKILMEKTGKILISQKIDSF